MISLIGLGSNLGARSDLIRRAIELLEADDQIDRLQASRLYRSCAVGGPGDQPQFLNAVVRLETDLPALVLLHRLQRIEKTLGRERTTRWGSRTIDLDLLLYGDAVIDSAELSVPHPRMAFRRFVLQPAVDIAAELLHPTTGWSLERLLSHLDTAPDYIALAGPAASIKTSVTRQACALTGARLILDPVDAQQLSRLSTDPTSLVEEAEIQFLARRAALLDIHSWPTDEAAISDFWFDQALAESRIRLEDTSYRRFQKRWQATSAAVVQPKLIVLIDPPLTKDTQRIKPHRQSGPTIQTPPDLPDPRDTDWQNRLRSELETIVNMPHQGPVLKLSTSDETLIVAEVEAAIRALREPCQGVE